MTVAAKIAMTDSFSFEYKVLDGPDPIPSLTVKELDAQIDLLHALKLPGLSIPATKSARGKKSDKQALLQTAFDKLTEQWPDLTLRKAYLSNLKDSLLSSGSSEIKVVQNWEETEAEILGEDDS